MGAESPQLEPQNFGTPASGVPLTLWLGKAFVAVLLAGCSARVPVTDVPEMSATDRGAAMNVRVYTVNQAPPKIERSIGPMTAYSCKDLAWDALEQLQLQAARAGANAVINVTFDKSGPDDWGSKCWKSLQASGTAVLVRD